LIKIKELLHQDYSQCYELLDYHNGDLDYFRELGWSLKEFNLQFLKEISFSLGLFNENKLEGFLIGNLITIEKKTEYEILLLYVNNKKRNLGYATTLLANILSKLKKKKLVRIYLEVAENNAIAINLYYKNAFKKISVRNDYYKFKNKKTDAIILEKIINE
tara:strand:- start:49 stop:531 length:483 start_codon:yes stop_codon:yes gene_type:complete